MSSRLEIHLVLPDHWSETTARILADRLERDELPPDVVLGIVRVENGEEQAVERV